MKRIVILVTAALACTGALATSKPGQTGHVPSYQAQAAIAGAKSNSDADASAKSASLSGAVSGALSSAEGGKAVSNATGGDALSSSAGGDARATGGEGGHAFSTSGDSSAQSASDAAGGHSDVGVSSYVEGDRYPEIPVNAGVVFASICQEGSSATNSKVSISLVTDSSFCNRLTLADAYLKMFTYYAAACNEDSRRAQVSDMHTRFVASQVKGVYVSPQPAAPKTVRTCTLAEEYRLNMATQLAEAQSMLDDTKTTGFIAKVAAQLGIPISLAYVLLSVL